VALQDDAGLVELAYRQASLGNHVEALGTLARISDPGYGPKVQSLIRLWGGDAANELVGEAQRLLALGQVEQARQGLARALTLPASPATRRKAQALLDDLKGNPGTK
jgi:hypothetical protein